MTEATCSIARLDRSRPPPGYGKSWMSARFAGAGNTLAAAWAHYEARRDPPGLVVWCDPLSGGDVWWWGDKDRHYGEEEREEADARAAAWAWYWRRVKLATLLDDIHVAPLAATWPACLAWSDEHVANMEQKYPEKDCRA